MEKLYEDRVCLFLDILGFSEHVRQTQPKDKDENFSKVNEIANLLHSLPAKLNSFGNSNDYRQMTQFSDSIVVSFQLTDKNAFIELLDDIVQITMNLIIKGYLVRGGITYGKLYHKNNIVFGPAMITAYELESKIAMYPRVIFDKELVDELIKSGDIVIASLINNNIESSYFWREDIDGKYYLNFLKGSEMLMDSSDYYGFLLPTLRKYIFNALKNRTSQSVRIKYGWLKTKYNERIEEIKQEMINDNSIIIPKPL